MEQNDVLSVCIDTIKGAASKYTAAQTSDELRAAFIEMNGGSTKISPKTFRPGNALFDLVQELVPVMIDEGIRTSENPLFNLVDYRNIAAGDEAEFVVEGDANFIVATATAGIRDVRRQRIAGGRTVKIDTFVKIVRVYENLGRLLAGRIDFNTFVTGVTNAFIAYASQLAYDTLSGITASTAGLNSTYVKSGSITEANLLTLCEHVEAATGKKATIVGTKTAIRKLGSSVTNSAEINSDLYNQGFIGRMAGVAVIGIAQAHKPGTDTFALDDDALWVLAGDSKPIKLVNAGDGLMILRDATENADLTQEYVYAQEMGCGVVISEKMGYWYSIV